MAFLLSSPIISGFAAPVSTSAPSFDAFLTRAVNDWQGASYSWQASDSTATPEMELMPLGVAPGFVTAPSPSSTKVSEVMRSCGGAVQGVEEARTATTPSGKPADATVMLNRQTDGTTFFDGGSWAMAPPKLSTDADAEKDFLASTEAFGISICLSHADVALRKRLLVVVAGDGVAAADVAVEEVASVAEAAPDGEHESEAINALLGRRLQCVVEANAWEGGADVVTLAGSAPIVGAPWLNARTRWTKSEDALEGSAPLVPADCACYLPGGLWVKVSDGAEPGSKRIEVGSVCAEAAEVATISHEYSQDGVLTAVALGMVTSKDE